MQKRVYFFSLNSLGCYFRESNFSVLRWIKQHPRLGKENRFTSESPLIQLVTSTQMCMLPKAMKSLKLREFLL